MLKKLLVVFGVLIVVAGIGVNYLWSNLDSILRSQIEKYGSAATQTTVHLDHIKLSLTTGEGSLSGLSVGSPKGFSASKTLYLGSVSVAVDTQSLRGSGPIVIRDITIEKPQIAYEITSSGDSNLKAIQRNAQSYAGATDQTATSQPTASSASSRKIIISSLTIRDGQIAITEAMLQGRQLNAPLPTIHLTNIGKSSDGATPADIAQVLLGAITESASKVATMDLAKELGNVKGLVGGAAGGAVNSVGGVGSQLTGFLGK